MKAVLNAGAKSVAVLAIALAVAVLGCLGFGAGAAHADQQQPNLAIAAGSANASHATNALLEADGFLSSCSSSGKKTGTLWSAETANDVLFDLVDVKTVFISPDVKEVGRFALRYQTSAGAVEVANNFTALYQFNALPSLKRIVFLDGSSASTIASYAFGSCKNLESVAMPASMRRVGSFAFTGCNNLRKVSLGSKLEVVESGAFANCISLASVVIPASVDEIQVGAFGGCSKLSSVKSRNKVPPTIGYGVFDGASTKLKIRVPKSSFMLYSTQWAAYAEKIVDTRSAQSFKLNAAKGRISVSRSKIGWTGKTISAKKAFKVSNAKGAVTFEKVSPSTPWISVSQKGAITLGFGAQAGSYTVKVKATAAGNAKYKPSTKTAKVKVRITK